MIDSTMTLPDGRTLAYTEVGAPGGAAALYFHGAPGSRFELLSLDDAFAAVGVRVITADRPGYGSSSPHVGRTTADWADDVTALADHLGLDRFVVMGLSSGGPYTVACASLLGDRVVGAIVAAGNTDMSWPESSAGYMQSELDIMAMDDEAAAVAWCEEHYGADGSGLFDGDSDMDLGPADNAWLADEANLASLMTTMGEAFAQGVVGYAHDITVQGRPWSFDPGAITCPTIVVHGADDQLVPLAHSGHTASLIPGAELRVLDGVGHLSLGDRLPALVARTGHALVVDASCWPSVEVRHGRSVFRQRRRSHSAISRREGGSQFESNSRRANRSRCCRTRFTVSGTASCNVSNPRTPDKRPESSDCRRHRPD